MNCFSPSDTDFFKRNLKVKDDINNILNIKVVAQTNLNGSRMGKKHVTNITSHLGGSLVCVFYKMALKFGWRVVDGRTEAALVYVTFLHDVSRHMELNLIFCRKRLLTLKTIDFIFLSYNTLTVFYAAFLSLEPDKGTFNI